MYEMNVLVISIFVFKIVVFSLKKVFTPKKKSALSEFLDRCPIYLCKLLSWRLVISYLTTIPFTSHLQLLCYSLIHYHLQLYYSIKLSQIITYLYQISKNEFIFNDNMSNRHRKCPWKVFRIPEDPHRKYFDFRKQHG